LGCCRSVWLVVCPWVAGRGGGANGVIGITGVGAEVVVFGITGRCGTFGDRPF
jgi:hypothetical protein